MCVSVFLFLVEIYANDIIPSNKVRDSYDIVKLLHFVWTDRFREKETRMRDRRLLTFLYN